MANHRFDPQDEFDEFEQDEFEQDELEQDDAGPRVERMRRQTGKTGKTVKTAQNLERRQREKEWGRSMSKFLKQRNRGSGKP